MFKVQDELQKNYFLSKTLILLLGCILTSTQVWANSITGQISRVGDTTHVEFKGRRNWQYEVKPINSTTMSITMPAFDTSTVLQLEAWNCPIIKSIKVNNEAIDKQYELIIEFTSNNVDSFDYLTDDPGAFIVDFFEKTAEQKLAESNEVKPKSDVNVAKLSKTKKIKKKSNYSDEYKRIERAPAGTEVLEIGQDSGTTANAEDPNANVVYQRGIFDGADPDFDRFRIKDYQIKPESIVQSTQNVYIPYPALELKTQRFQELMKNTPDYEIQINDEKESKEAAFLLTLHKRKHYGALFETISYFDKKYPHTKYKEIIENIKAEAHIGLYERDKNEKDYEQFRSQYRYLIETYPDSVLNERSSLLLAYSALERGDASSALQDFQKFAAKYPESKESERVQIAMAEALELLSKPDESIEAYKKIDAEAKEKNFAAEAKYRIGDVLFKRKKYREAILAYKEAVKKYPAYSKVFPNAAFNTAEAHFWLKEYNQTLESYIEFLKVFPTHRHGGYALARIGEVHEIFGVDKKIIAGAYMEGYFRYPDSPGSEIARIRMLFNNFANMKEREMKIALLEIDEMRDKSKLGNMDEFIVLLKAQGYKERKEYNKTLDLLLGFYQANPTTIKVDIFKQRIHRAMSDIMKTQIESNNNIDMLNFYGKYSTNWLKNIDRIDVPFMQARAYENLGVAKEAKKYYDIALEKLEHIKTENQRLEKQVYENLPTPQSTYLRLASIAIGEKQYKEAYTNLLKIKGPLSIEEEIEKIQMGAIVSEKMGNSKKAIEYLTKLIGTYVDKEELIVAPRISLARLLKDDKKLVDADKVLTLLEATVKNGIKVSDENKLEIMKLRGEQLILSGQKLAAVETYSRLLDEYESKYPLSSMRYSVGNILFEEGDLKGAEKVWGQLDDDKGSFYKKLAMDKLSQAEWGSNYKKYIDRSPASNNK